MVNGLWGKKIGMTQVFSEDNKVVPVTVIDVANWFVTKLKLKNVMDMMPSSWAVLKTNYADQAFSHEWLKEPRKYFSAFKEVPVDEELMALKLVQHADVACYFSCWRYC